jgi:hypothetical protein
MAFIKKREKDYHICEFCKIKPCMFEARGEVEYNSFCRNYIADSKKIANDKGRRG